MEKFCSKLLSIMRLEIANYIVITIFCAIAIIVCFFLRADKKFKILLGVSFICLIAAIALFANAIIPIYTDYSNKSFVVLEDATIVSSTLSGFDLYGIMEISIYTTEGNVIRLKTTDQLPNGEYKAYVVYSEKSNYLVDFKIVGQ